MRVMMLLQSDAQSEAGVLPSEELLTEMGTYNQTLVDAGVMKGGEGLHPSAEGARIRIERGKTTVLDGPFAEAKEVVAGYFMLETKDLDEAVEWAKRIPCVGMPAGQEGRLELRPLYEAEDFAPEAGETPSPALEQEARLRANPPPVPGPEQGQRWIHMLKADRFTEAGGKASQQLITEMGALMGEMVEKGVLIAGEGLKPGSQSKRVFVSKGKQRVVDGPFAESKELVAGFTIFRAKTKAEAIEWARRCLEIHMRGVGIETGEIEVRRVFETEEIPVRPEEKADGWREQEKRMREQLGQ